VATIGSRIKHARITNDDYKPPLLDEEALEHYGVKGMKWGVRRDRAALARAAGRELPNTRSRQAREGVRKAGGTPARGVGKNAAYNYRASGKQIRAARKEVKKAKEKVKNAKTVEDRRKAQLELDKNQARQVSAQITNGEAVAAILLAPVSLGTVTGAAAATMLNSQRLANRRENLIQAELMKGTSYKEVQRASAESIKKAARS
jgi:hypothetical protein